MSEKSVLVCFIFPCELVFNIIFLHCKWYILPKYINGIKEFPVVKYLNAISNVIEVGTDYMNLLLCVEIIVSTILSSCLN